MSADKRQHERLPLSVEVELTEPALGTRLVMTRDLSDGGVFVCVPRDQCPAVGTVVSLKIHGPLGGGEAPTVRARVVRVTADGIGLMFLEE